MSDGNVWSVVAELVPMLIFIVFLSLMWGGGLRLIKIRWNLHRIIGAGLYTWATVLVLYGVTMIALMQLANWRSELDGVIFIILAITILVCILISILFLPVWMYYKFIRCSADVSRKKAVLVPSLLSLFSFMVFIAFAIAAS